MNHEIAAQGCSKNDIRSIQDALHVLNGSWKLPILAALLTGKKRFNEIARDVEGISDKMLSKELRSLEINHLIKRTVYDNAASIVEYSITEHSATLRDVLNALSDWGHTHRKKIIGTNYAL